MRKLAARGGAWIVGGALALTLLGSASQAVASPLLYWGGPVARNPNVLLTFWGKNWNEHAGARTEIREMFAHLSGSGWQAILAQYYDTSGPISANVGFTSWTDESIKAPNAVSRAHTEDEIEYAIKQRGWPGPGINNIYVVLPAPGSKYEYVEGCGVHHFSSRIGAPFIISSWPGDDPFKGCESPGGGGQPWVGDSMTASHEYAEVVTSPIPPKDNGGIRTGWASASENEIGNLCVAQAAVQLPNGGWVQPIWDNSQEKCAVVKASTWHTDNLGGNVTSDSDVSSWGSNRLDVFTRGTNNALCHKSWEPANGWSAWEQIPGGPTITSGPGAVSWGPGRIDVVARVADGSVGHWGYQNGIWGYENLGGNITADPDISSWEPGRLDIFARGTDNGLFHRSWTGGWSVWEKIYAGTNLTSGPGAVSWGKGRIDVVARVAGSTVGHWSWGGAWSYEDLGGNITADPDISSWEPGRVDIFARGTDNGLFHRSWTGGWSVWEPIPGPALASGPGAVSWGKGRIDVAGKAADGSVSHWYWSP